MGIWERKEDSLITRLFEAIRHNRLSELQQLLASNQTFDVNQTYSNMQGMTLLHMACFGDSIEIVSYLLQRPKININAVDIDGWTSLMYACHKGQNDMVRLLLAQPAINVNCTSNDGSTALIMACKLGKTQCSLSLLQDTRTDINKAAANGRTALWLARYIGNVDIVNYYLAIADLPLLPGSLNPSALPKSLTKTYTNRSAYLGVAGDPKSDVVDAIASLYPTPRPELTQILKSYRDRPVITRHKLRLQLGMSDGLAADIFALVIFLSDGLLTCKDTLGNLTDHKDVSDHPIIQAFRFFTITKQLSMELQMSICQRVAESAKDNISTLLSEPAFQSLAKVYN